MVYIIVFIAFILAWFFIEITLFLLNKNLININESGKFPYNKFIRNLRILATFLFFSTLAYMYNFDNDNFLDAVEYCLGVIK